MYKDSLSLHQLKNVVRVGPLGQNFLDPRMDYLTIYANLSSGSICPDSRLNHKIMLLYFTNASSIGLDKNVQSSWNFSHSFNLH